MPPFYKRSRGENMIEDEAQVEASRRRAVPERSARSLERGKQHVVTYDGTGLRGCQGYQNILIFIITTTAKNYYIFYAVVIGL